MLNTAWNTSTGPICVEYQLNAYKYRTMLLGTGWIESIESFGDDFGLYSVLCVAFIKSEKPEGIQEEAAWGNLNCR